MMIIIKTDPKDDEDSLYEIQRAMMINAYQWEDKSSLYNYIREYLDFEDKKRRASE